MTEPNDDLVETIQRALEQYDEIRSRRNLSVAEYGHKELIEDMFDLKHITDKFPEWLRALLEERERLKGTIKWWQDRGVKDSDLLQQTREELEQLREDNHQNAADLFHELQTELEQVKAERDEAGEIVKAAVIPCRVCLKNGCDCNVTYISDFATGEMVVKQHNEIESLSTELAAKDKVLESITDYPPFEETNNGDRFYEQMRDDARSILSQYKGESQ